MTIPGNPEPGAVSGPHQVQLQHSGYLSSAIPIKKRRYPVIRPLSPKPEESFDTSGSKEQKSDGGLCSSDAKNADLVGNSDVRKVLPFILKRVQVAPANEEFRCANVGMLLRKKSLVSVGAGACLRKRMSILSNEKQEIGEQAEGAGRAAVLTSPMNVELSLGSKGTTPVSALECEKSEAVDIRPRVLDPSLLTLGSARDKVLLHKNSSEGSADQSNWDLNTTVDAWKSSTDGVSGLGKSDGCSDVIVSLTGTSTVGQLNSGRNCSLIDKSTSTNCGLHLNLEQVKPSSVDVIRTVKSERVDDNAKQDCSIGSCSSSSSNVGLLKFDSVKRELVGRNRLRTALQSSASPDKSDGSEAVEGNQEASKSDDAIRPRTVARRIIQHQETCASSSAVPAPLTPQNSCGSRLLTCSVLTTCGEFNGHNDNLEPVNQDKKHSTLCNVGNSSLEDPHEFNLAQVDECHSRDVPTDGEEKINTSTEMFEEDSFGSDSESEVYPAIGTTKDVGENTGVKNEEEFEDREALERLGQSAGKDPDVEGKKAENLERINVPSSKDTSYSPHSEDETLQKLSDKVLETTLNQKRSNNDAPHECPDVLGIKYFGKDPAKRVSRDRLTNGSNAIDGELVIKTTDKVDKEISSRGNAGKGPAKIVSRHRPSTMDNELGNTATNKSGKGICSRGNDRKDPAERVSRDGPTNESSAIDNELGNKAIHKVSVDVCSRGNDFKSPKGGASLKCRDAAGGFNGVGKTGHIINLPRTSTVKSSGEMRSIENSVPMPRRGKGRYSNRDGNVHPQLNRHEFGSGGSKKYARGSGFARYSRNPRPSFMRGKGRKSGRFDQVHGEWDSNRDFTTENCTGPAFNISDIESECNGYGIEQDDTALVRSRREAINDDFSSQHRKSRRPSSGYRGRNKTRPYSMLHGIPRNISRKFSSEDDSNVIGLRHGDEFMLQLSDNDIFDPNCSSPQVVYDDLDSPFSPGSRDFYRRMRSRSPNRLPPELTTDHGSPDLYRLERMRSHDRACFRDEYIDRRQESPSFITRHPNKLREVDPRYLDSDRRGFHSRPRREALDSQGLGYGENEYIDGNVDDRRMTFAERWGPFHQIHPNYTGDVHRLHFDNPRPYRLCSDANEEFVDMEGREFDRRIPSVLPRQDKNVEEQEDKSCRRAKQAWRDDGFSEATAKRRKRRY